MITREELANLFQINEEFPSGGKKAVLRILAIDSDCLRYQSIKNQQPNHVKFSYLQTVVEGFARINPKQIQKSIQQVFTDAGLRKNYSTENYVYGIAREYIDRSGRGFLSSGEYTAENVGGTLEGTLKQVLVNRFERSARNRELCINHHGTICKICNFDFGAFYGDLGRGFIHVHHLKELASLKEAKIIDPITELIPVCANCHCMLHQKTPALLPEELRQIISGNSVPAFQHPAGLLKGQ